jgi:hypothetical protein
MCGLPEDNAAHKLPDYPRPEAKGVYVIAWNDKTAFYLIKVQSEWSVFRTALPLIFPVTGRWECSLTHFRHFAKRGVYDWCQLASDEEVQQHIDHPRRKG